MPKTNIAEAYINDDVVRRLNVKLDNGVSATVFISLRDSSGSELGKSDAKETVFKNKIKHTFNVGKEAKKLGVKPNEVDHVIVSVDIENDAVRKGEEPKLKIKHPKVVITYSGANGDYSPVILTDKLIKTVDKTEVLESIKKVINPAMLDMALEKMKDQKDADDGKIQKKDIRINESYFTKYNHPIRRNFIYPIKFEDKGNTLYISLILLNDIPKDSDGKIGIIAEGLFKECKLTDAKKLANDILNDALFFNSQTDENTYMDEWEPNSQPATKPSIDKRISAAGFNESKLLIALTIFAKTKRGKYLLGIVKSKLSYSNPFPPTSETKEEKEERLEEYIYGPEADLLMFVHTKDTDSSFQAIRFIGEGRFNPQLGYMPGALIIAHEIGHTQFAGRAWDHNADGLPLDRYGNSNKLMHNNLVKNENPMRKNFGMVPREGYREHGKCYNNVGKEEPCPPHYKHVYKLNNILDPLVKVIK